MNDSFIIMCRDSLTPNMRKEVEEIVAAKLKERENERTNQSTDSLLKELLDQTKKMNEFLKNNSHKSMEINRLIVIFTASALLCALTSITIASIQLLVDGKDGTGMVILYGLSVAIIILIIGEAKNICDSRKKLKENT